MNSTFMPKIDNTIYDSLADTWWADTGFAVLLRDITHQWRIQYFRSLLGTLFGNKSNGIKLLDIGCGGGILAEDFATLGLCVTGIDPSAKSIETAKSHASQSELNIDYHVASGNSLPFGNETFDIISCCDVLEHIHDWQSAIAEGARTLKPGGIFLYDTINRTAISKMDMIEVAQDNELTRFLPRNLHAWEMFIKPDELHTAFNQHGLRNEETRGIKRRDNVEELFGILRQHNQGQISTKQLAKHLLLLDGDDTESFYMGYAVKA